MISKNFIATVFYRGIIIFLLIIQTSYVLGQDIKVANFHLLETDMTANTRGTIVLDQNGEKCALIKISSAKTGFSFDAGMLGIVKTIQHPGEIWLYVPAGVKRLSISHEGMESLSNFDLGMTLQKAKTYSMVLKTSGEIASQELIFNITPGNCVVILEPVGSAPHLEKRVFQLTDGRATVRMPVGKYAYTVMSDGCTSEEGVFSLTESSSRKLILELRPSQDNTFCKIGNSTSPTFRPIEDTTVIVSRIRIHMVGVQGGTFSMGATDATDAEKPVHFVTLDSYRICDCEVTQELWTSVMGNNPSMLRKHPRYPVEMVSWDDCLTFISKLNSMTGLRFRLPTEAEWEYACRGGIKSQNFTYSGGNDISEVAWYKGNSMGFTHEVKTRKPNELGIYDMSGNVYEWCSDRYAPYDSDSQTNPIGATGGANRITRGGGVMTSPSGCRPSARSNDIPTARFCTLGVRLAM